MVTHSRYWIQALAAVCGVTLDTDCCGEGQGSYLISPGELCVTPLQPDAVINYCLLFDSPEPRSSPALIHCPTY